MKKTVYLVRVEGTNYPAIFIDARRFNRLVEVVAPFDRAVRVIAVSRYGDFITDNDLRVYVEMFNYFKNML